MKNIMKLLIGALVVSTVLISCKKDKDKETKNFLKIGETEYDLSAGLLTNYGKANNGDLHLGYNTDLTLYSKGLLLQTGEDDWDLIGKGHAIYFQMFSSAGNVLDNMKYTYSSAIPSPIGTFDGGQYIINYVSETEDTDFADIMLSGEVNVSINGSEYTISINCTGKNGKKITGFYKGTLRYFDRSRGEKFAPAEPIKIEEKLFK